MGRHRIPTATQVAKGAFKKDPQRKAIRADLGPDGKVIKHPLGPVGDPPIKKGIKQASIVALLTPESIWFELIEMLPPGVLTRSDRAWLEITCRLLSKDRQGKITASERSQLMKCLSMMGMSPVDRSKVTANLTNYEKAQGPDFSEFTTPGLPN